MLFLTIFVFFVGAGWVAGARNARLYTRDDFTTKRIGSWCAAYGHYDNQWLKIDLGKVKQITAVATQGALSVTRIFWRNFNFFDDIG